MLAHRQRIDDMDIRKPEPDISLLVSLAGRGDRSAFEAIYKLHVNRIYALALRMSSDVDLAASLTQDAFVKAWQNLGSFRGDAQFSTWLHRLAVNVILDHQRRQKRRDGYEIATGDLQEEGQFTASTAPVATGDKVDLEKAISGLPTGARSIFVLHDIEGYKMREIAEATGSALGTIKAQLHRARRLLREALSC
jgi:RNA polymerase sigma-70 factor, ECF subfamily